LGQFVLKDLEGLPVLAVLRDLERQFGLQHQSGLVVLKDLEHPFGLENQSGLEYLEFLEGPAVPMDQ
jgi:hypothetical protein